MLPAMGQPKLDDSWIRRGACIDMPPELFTKPGKTGTSSSTRHITDPVCEACIVQKECYNWGRYYALPGIYGGATLKERKAVKWEDRVAA